MGVSMWVCAPGDMSVIPCRSGRWRGATYRRCGGQGECHSFSVLAVSYSKLMFSNNDVKDVKSVS